MPFLSILLVHILKLQIIGIRLMFSREARYTLCWIGITPTYAVVQNTVLAPMFCRPFNPEGAAEGEKLLSAALSKIESFWLEGNGPFLLGANQPSIADLSLVCDIMQLELLDEADRNRLLSPYKKVQQWIENTRNATNPHFDEVHKSLKEIKEQLQK